MSYVEPTKRELVANTAHSLLLELMLKPGVKRLDHEAEDYKVSIYRVGDLLRIDIKVSP